MKRIIAILIAAALMLSMTTLIIAAVAELTVQSVQGTAVIDGEKDAAYDNAAELVFNQSGQTNGGGVVLDTPAGYAYVINDNDYVYIFANIIDDDIDDSSANRYERDSIEVFYMEDNKYQQIRFHIDGHADETKSTNYIPPDEDWELVLTDTGYAFEFRMPITDVLNNQIEMCLQINSCSGGSRQRCVYISGNTDGDEACQRTTRQDFFDGWWTLDLVGEFEDTRVDPEEEADEITSKNYAEIQALTVFAQLYSQDAGPAYAWNTIGSGANVAFGQTTEFDWSNLFMPDLYNADNTSNWSLAPTFAIQIGVDGWNPGDTAHYQFTYTDITIKATGYDDVIVPAGEVDGKWTARQESWGIAGTSSAIDLRTPVMGALGLDVEGFCEYLKNLTDVTTTITFTAYNLITPADIEAFAAELETLEQEWIDTDETLAEQVLKANEALAAAQADPENADVVADALKDANNAKNRAVMERSNAGWTEGGLADSYINDTFDVIISEIQALADAVAPADEVVGDGTANDNNTVDPNSEADDAAHAENSESGSATGIIVGVIIAAVVVAAVVCAVLLGKKKK